VTLFAVFATVPHTVKLKANQFPHLATTQSLSVATESTTALGLYLPGKRKAVMRSVVEGGSAAIALERSSTRFGHMTVQSIKSQPLLRSSSLSVAFV
jgi:hypothetical protein